MTRFESVDPNLYRGSRPNTASDISFLKSKGINKIISLDRPFGWWLIGQVPPEDIRLEQAGIQEFRLDWGWVPVPTESQIRNALWMLDTFLENGNTVYVHCAHGVDRTGVLIAGYRVQHGWSPGAAIQEMLNEGFHQKFYRWWLPSVQESLQNIQQMRVNP